MNNPPKEPRKKSREARRVELIEATIKTIAARGFSRTTLTEVARTAGLSHGLVLFHFSSKEQLLEDTLQYLSEEYRMGWTAALASASASPAARLDALIRADFDLRLVSEDRLSAWCAFWGEAQSRPLYQAKCGASDDEYNKTIDDLCAQLCAEGGYPHAPERIARALRTMVEGIWLDLMVASTPFSPSEGLATVYAAVSAFFPKHFDPAGLIGSRA